MSIIKKTLALLLAVLCVVSMFACDSKKGKDRDDDDDNGVNTTVKSDMQFVAGIDGVFAAYAPMTWEIENVDSDMEVFTLFSEDGELAMNFEYEDDSEYGSSKELLESMLADLTDEYGDDITVINDISSVTVGGKSAKTATVKLELVGGSTVGRLIGYTDGTNAYMLSFTSNGYTDKDETFDFAPYESDIKDILNSFVFGKNATVPDASDSVSEDISEEASEDRSEMVDVIASQTPDQYSDTTVYDAGPFTVRFPSAYITEEGGCMSPNGLEALIADYQAADRDDTLEDFVYDMIDDADERNSVESSPTRMYMGGKEAYAVCVSHISDGRKLNSAVAVSLVNGNFCIVGYSSATVSMTEVKNILSDVIETVSFDQTDVANGMLLAEQKLGYYTLYVPDEWVSTGNGGWQRSDGNANVSVAYQSASGYDSLDAVVSAARSELNQSMPSQYDGFKIETGNQRTKLGGTEAVMFGYTVTVGATDIYGIQVYCIEGSILYCVTYTMAKPEGELGDELQEDFEDILDCFRFR